jgi:luciferase-type oxidoreductase
MLTPNTLPWHQQLGFRRTYREGQLTLGLIFPIEAFAGDTPTMLNQVNQAKHVEALGFAALWVRDVPLRDPSFGDVGQIFDPWVYLGFMAAHTCDIALGTAAIVLPIRHPLHTAKAAASVDQLSQGRLLLGVASGDRPVEFPAFGVDPEQRGQLFREYLDVLRQVQHNDFTSSSLSWPGGMLQGADLIPKPTTTEIPFFVTGHSRQSLDWIALHSHGWMSYPRALYMQKLIVEDWRASVRAQAGEIFKPFTQSLYVDLTPDPVAAPERIHLGYRLGREHLIGLLQTLQDIGVNHVILNLKYGQRPAGEVVEESGEFVVPHFSLPG